MSTKDTKRRGRGEDSIYWDEANNCWVGAISLGYTASGKRLRPKVTGKNKTEVRDELKKLHAEIEDGVTSSARYTVEDAVRKWLDVGLKGRDPSTIEKNRILAETHIIPAIGAAKLRDLTADDLDEWLEDKATTPQIIRKACKGKEGQVIHGKDCACRALATSTLRELLSMLRRAITVAQRRNMVARNVAELVDGVPTGSNGRPSRALTMTQALALLTAAAARRLYAYIVVCLLTGIRTEEARALTWSRTHLVQADGQPPHLEVWRSVRATGDTKTEKSRRTLKLPSEVVEALKAHRVAQARDRLAAGELWQDHDLVFCTQVGTALDAANVRRQFRAVVAAAGIEGGWVPRELRHSFVSLLSAHGVRIEEISRLVGHKGTAVTEKVYRQELRPVLTEGAEAMSRIFPGLGG